jgi:hypothetical protein
MPKLPTRLVSRTSRKQSKAKQSKAKQSKAKQSKAKQSKAKQSKAKQIPRLVVASSVGEGVSSLLLCLGRGKKRDLNNSGKWKGSMDAYAMECALCVGGWISLALGTAPDWWYTQLAKLPSQAPTPFHLSLTHSKCTAPVSLSDGKGVSMR